MGVIYKLKDEVVQFIISQRQSNPLFSCRQLAESASEKFGLHLSKSSVHDVLKESGIVTPRGRKPKLKFTIPQEKKQQIQSSLAQVNLLLPPVSRVEDHLPTVEKEVKLLEDVTAEDIAKIEISAPYEGAGKIFLKAARWDLGVFSDDPIKETDWDYLLTYSKGIKVNLENDKSFFIDLVVPIERCIREVVDGLVNNINKIIVYRVSDELLFKASMEAQNGFKISNICIVDQKDHSMFELSEIVVIKRSFERNNIVFVESYKKEPMERVKSLFFPQDIENYNLIEEILNLKGFDATDKYENTVNLLLSNSYENKILFQDVVDKLNGMCLRDEQGRRVKVKLVNSG